LGERREREHSRGGEERQDRDFEGTPAGSFEQFNRDQEDTVEKVAPGRSSLAGNR